MNFATEVVDAAPPHSRALIELTRAGERREWSFGEVSEKSALLAGKLASLGVSQGDVVMTLIGNRAEWVLSMVACFRIGAVVLPCTEQLRASDLRLRVEATRPRVIVADPRNRAALEKALAATDPALSEPVVLLIGEDDFYDCQPAAAVDLSAEDGCLITFTSGTSGSAKPVVHAQRYLQGQRLQAEHWLAARGGYLVWCTAASGWSKSARNVFIAPWLRGAAALLHDERFDAAQRLQIAEQEKVSVLCMAPTEYRLIAAKETIKPIASLRSMVAAGEALGSDVLETFEAATGLLIRDGYGQTETGQITGVLPSDGARPGSMGRPLPGVRAWVDESGQLVLDPATVPTFCAGYLVDGELVRQSRVDAQPWQTGDLVRQDDDGFLFFEGRNDDVIISSGYRIGPFEVETVLGSHPAVQEAAVVAHPDSERGSVVRAVVVLQTGVVPSEDLARTLQSHVRATTAPYKYPRIVEFVEELPKTASGKIRRASLRSA